MTGLLGKVCAAADRLTEAAAITARRDIRMMIFGFGMGFLKCAQTLAL